jgi:hypothetical protein
MYDPTYCWLLAKFSNNGYMRLNHFEKCAEVGISGDFILINFRC